MHPATGSVIDHSMMSCSNLKFVGQLVSLNFTVTVLSMKMCQIMNFALFAHMQSQNSNAEAWVILCICARSKDTLYASFKFDENKR